MNLPLQMLRFIVFSIYFPFLYAVWGAFINMQLNYENYGILYGLIAVVAGCVNLISDPLVAYALKQNSFIGANSVSTHFVDFIMQRYC